MSVLVQIRPLPCPKHDLSHPPPPHEAMPHVIERGDYAATRSILFDERGVTTLENVALLL